MSALEDNATTARHPDCNGCGGENCVASTTGGDLWCCICGAHAGTLRDKPRPVPYTEKYRRRYYFASGVTRALSEILATTFRLNSPRLDWAERYLELGPSHVGEPPSVASANLMVRKADIVRGSGRTLFVYFKSAEWVLADVAAREPG